MHHIWYVRCGQFCRRKHICVLQAQIHLHRKRTRQLQKSSQQLAVIDVRMQVGQRLLQRHVFIHLEDDSDKFLLLMEMLHKLYALVNLQCCEDSPDALTHHEILLPGQLLVKYFKEKAEEAVHELGEQARFWQQHESIDNSTLVQRSTVWQSHQCCELAVLCCVQGQLTAFFAGLADHQARSC